MKLNSSHRSYGSYLLVSVLSLLLIMGCEETTEPNHSPVITSLTISPASPTFGDTLSLSAVATDEDNDELTYSWSEANGTGQFVATDAADVQWIANFQVAANAIFKVTVSDGDLSASASNAVLVSSADPPEFYYVGSSTCGQCHEDEYADVINSGHPYKFNFVDGQAPTYPDFVEAGRTLPLPDGAASWDDIVGVIGGFGWKARFVDNTGNLVGTANSVINTGGGQNQYNFYSGTDWGWADYHPEDVKEYNYGCFRCHTTGATETGEWLPGIQGTFVYGGIECERCHGPGSKHVEADAAIYIDHPEGDDITELCGQCHYRNSDHSVATKGGFIKHHEQYDEFIHSKHYLDAGQTCSTCHDPHKRVIWDGDGITQGCTTNCHGTQTAAAPHDVLDCDKCHMAKLAKSAVQTVDGYRADVHSHTFTIAADTTWDMFSDDGSTLREEGGYTKLALDKVCYGCHTDADGGGGSGSAKTLTQLNDYVASIHP